MGYARQSRANVTGLDWNGRLEHPQPLRRLPSAVCPQFSEEGVNQFDPTIFEITGIAGSNRIALRPGNSRNLAIGYAHRAADFLAMAHDLAVETGRRLVVG